jgi:peptidyl-prolyl cis-trans isomerase D
MLAWFRKLLENWIARVFFGLLLVVFVFWGISNVVTLVSSSTTVAHVAGKPVEIAAVQAEYQSELSHAEQKGPADPDERRQIAQSALATILRQKALAAVEADIGIVAPDSAVRTEIAAIPAFQTNGVFDQQKFDQVLLQNNLSPSGFIGEEQADIANRQLVQALTDGVIAPAPLVQQIFGFIAQARIAETVDISTATQTPPPAPSDTVLRRYWKNHPTRYTAPEYRTIKLVILSPAVLAPTEPVSDAELRAAYAHVAATQKVAASRSVQVVTCPDDAKAAKIAADWRSGATWQAVQAEATKDSAAAVELDHAAQDQFPSPVLGAAVFAATPRAVTGPVQGPFGYFVFDVTDAVAAGAPAFSQVKDQLKQDLQLQKAQADVNQDVDNVQDALAGQTPLDKLPGNLGLTAVEGTLDANGNALDGTPAPIPGGAKLVAAVVKAVFAAHPGDPAQLITGPENSYFAFTIDKITPPAAKPYDQVKSQVASDWRQDALSREAEQKAAALLQAVNGGQTLDAAASAAGEPIAVTPPITRGAQPPADIPQTMISVLFGMKQGQATMQQTADGFLVAVLTKILQPDPAQQAQQYQAIQDALAKSLQNDVTESFLAGLQTREHVAVDPKLFAQIYQ